MGHAAGYASAAAATTECASGQPRFEDMPQPAVLAVDTSARVPIR